VQADLYSVCAVILFALGLIAFLVKSGGFHKVLALNVMGIGVFMLLLATSAFYPNAIDPLTHGMVLTGIVVAVAGSALALNLATQIDLPSQSDDMTRHDKPD
jgi:multicomponent Na+:H+ antiporter subunit C